MNEGFPNDAMIGQRLREARQRAKLAQRHGQAVIDVTRPTFIAIEKGRRPVKPIELIALCNRYGCEVSEIIGGTATRLAKSDPLGMFAEVVDWVRRYDAGEVSEGQLSKFLGTDRVGAREIVIAVRSMVTVVMSLLPNGPLSAKAGAA